MQFIDVLIYILASVGLLFTVISIVDTYSCANYNSCYNLNLKKENKAKIIIKISDFDIAKKEEILEKIKKGKYNNINDIADNVEIINYN